MAKRQRARRSPATKRPRTARVQASPADRKLPSQEDRASRAEIDTQLAGTQSLPAFLGTAGQLSLDDRRRLVDQALVLLEQTYVHLPLKRAMHAVEPLQRLRLLQHRLSQLTADTMPPELAFHAEMIDVFTSLRDLHTNYLLPQPFRGRVAFLPFLVEDCVEDGHRTYLVTKLLAGFTHQNFRPGVTLVSWNGIPAARAVELNADRQAGSNLDARHARGVDALTIRPLTLTLPPDEQWVLVEYRDLDGTARTLRFDWQVFTPEDDEGRADPNDGRLASTAIGLDLLQDKVQQAKKLLFAPKAVEAARASARRGIRAAVAADDLPTSLPDVFRARSVSTPAGTFGYVRIFTFNVDEAGSFVGEFLRLVEALPDRGLILDVRDNGGGLILASEDLLQVLTPRPIEPEPVQFINTPLTLQLCKLHSPSPFDASFDLSPWTASIAQSVETGAVYSRSVSITPRGEANAIGQRYHGPVILITDARCYSATDIFAAGFQDHEIGPVLGTDGNTGAGGANVWTHELLRMLCSEPPAGVRPLPGTPFLPLPKSAAMRVSIRRTLRVAERAGTPVEDLGIVPDRRHQRTRNDLLNGNADLIAAAARVLSTLPARKLAAAAAAAVGGRVTIRMETRGLDRVDVYTNGRPVQTTDVTDGTRDLQVPSQAGLNVELRGFDAGRLVATRRLAL